MVGHFGNPTLSPDGFHGFLLSGGSYTTIEPPGALHSTALAINDSGQIVGNFEYADGLGHGFLLSGDSYTTIDPPGSLSTGVSGINASGQVVGTFLSGSPSVAHGFLFSGGSYTTIDVLGSVGTSVSGINASGQVVGTFGFAASSQSHGFLFSGGKFTTIDPPGSTYTLVFAINDSGQMAGTYYDRFNGSHGFLTGNVVTLLDPVPNLLNGPAVTTDSSALSAPSIARQVSGVSADGVTQVVVRILAPVAGEPYSLTLMNDSNSQSNSADEDGALGNLGASTFSQNQVVVTAVDTINGPMAFAIYRAPVDFARPLNTSDAGASQRSVSIQMVDNVTATSTTATVQIFRPPVALIHGLWSSSATWNDFAESLNSSNLFGIYRVNYQDSNFVQVQINEVSSLTQLTKFLEIFKSTRGGVAATQFDLVGHSMGGLISRYMVLDSRFNMDGNYKQGWIHKLITIDTPHAGSIIPALLDESGPACHSILADAGMPIDGATHDLEPNSPLLQTLYSLPLPPTHAIAGYMTPTQDAAASLAIHTLLFSTGGAPALACSTLFLHVVPFSFSGLYGEPNDLAVGESSQDYGLALTADVVPGIIHSGPVLPWLVQWVGAPPGALTPASGNPALVLNLLNAPSSSGAFLQGQR